MRPLDDAEARSKVQDIFAAGADKRVYCLLLRHTGNIVGYALMVPYFSSEYGGCVVVLDELFILPELQGQGLGGRALEALKAWSREQGMKRVILEVTEKNSRVIRLYERGGFTLLDRRLMSWATNQG